MERESIGADTVLSNLHHAFHHKERFPDGGDPAVAILGKVACEQIIENPHVRENLVEITHLRNINALKNELIGYNDPYILTNIIQRVINYDRINDDDFDFAVGATDKKIRKLLLHTLVNMRDEYSFEYEFRTITSNIDNRYWALKFGMQVYRHILGYKPTVFDFCASQNHGLRRFHHQATHPFQQVIVSDPGAGTVYEGELNVDRKLMANLNSDYLQRPTNIGLSRGFDAYSLRDSGNRKWAKACSFYFSELSSSALRSKYDMLDEEVEGVDFTTANCADPDELQKKIGDLKADVVSIFYGLYMNDEGGRQAITDTAIERAERLVLVLDVAKQDPDSPYGLNIRKKIQDDEDNPFGHELLVYDKRYPELGFVSLFKFKDGRIRMGYPNMEHPEIRKALLTK